VEFGRPIEEYLADFIVVPRRKLTLLEYVVFTRIWIWRWSVRNSHLALAIGREQIIDLIKGIEVKLGRAYAATGMRPVDYFDELASRYSYLRGDNRVRRSA
jgi:hypothetical protein